MAIESNGHQRWNGRFVNQPVLVLNQNYEPLNVCTLKRAIVLVFADKAEILEDYHIPVRTAADAFAAPSVIRLYRLIRRPRPRVKLTRREIFARDGYTCQYCGIRGGDLTVDHVIPRSRGGPHEWDNVVTACRSCNHRKGGKTLAEARMRLTKEPFEPRAGMYYAIERRMNSSIYDDWLPFLPGLEASASPLTLSSSSD